MSRDGTKVDARVGANAPADYDPSKYAPSAITTDLALLTIRNGRLAVLLVERAAAPFAGYWALPGGFVRPDEDLDTAATRELAEETGIDVHDWHVEQLRTYGAPERDPRMRVLSVAYVVFMPTDARPVAGSAATRARFWAIDDLTASVSEGALDDAVSELSDHAKATPSLAFDHACILADAVERVRAKLEYTTLAASFLDEPFTLSELRHVYETVWDCRLDTGNFRRKVLSADGFVVSTGSQCSTAGRPAALYTRGAARALSPPLVRPGNES